MSSNCTAVRVRPPGVDVRTGDPLEDEPGRVTLVDPIFAPVSSADINDRGRSGVTVDGTLFLHYGADLIHTDQVEIDGVLYDVVGELGQWKNPFTGWNAGSEVALKRAAG